MAATPKPFDFITPLSNGTLFYGNIRVCGNAWPDDDGFNYEVTAITFNDANIFGLYEYDDAMRFGFSTDVHKAVLGHCEWLFPKEIQ